MASAGPAQPQGATVAPATNATAASRAMSIMVSDIVAPMDQPETAGSPRPAFGPTAAPLPSQRANALPPVVAYRCQSTGASHPYRARHSKATEPRSTRPAWLIGYGTDRAGPEPIRPSGHCRETRIGRC